MRQILQLFLKILASRVVNRYKPVVIGITGSVGKTLTKEAIYAVLSRKFHVRKTEENFNNELGVPLTVLGVKPNLSTANIHPKNWGRLFKFLRELLPKLWLASGFIKQGYPEILVLELAAAKPGDIGYLVDIVKPKIGVVTAVGEMPVHVEFYASPQAVAKEKSRLIEQLPPNGLAVLNYDDQTVLDMKEKTKAKVVTFGFSKEADVWASDVGYFMSDSQAPIVGGLSFKLNHGGSFVPARLNNMIARHHLYGALAAAAVGLHFGINLITIAESIENIEPPKHRMALKRGIKNSTIVDDTYNASPLSTHAALDALTDLNRAIKIMGHPSSDAISTGGGRRVAVLGDMRELGKYEFEAHRTIGNLAAERCDVLVTVGAAGKIIADSAANQMRTGAIFSFSTSEEAAPKVQEIIQEGDIVLVKGSRAMEMEKVVEEIEIIS